MEHSLEWHGSVLREGEGGSSGATEAAVGEEGGIAQGVLNAVSVVRLALNDIQEREKAVDHRVENHTEAVDVARIRIVGLSGTIFAEDLGSNVARAGADAHRSWLSRNGNLREPKVDEAGTSRLGIIQHVLELQVSVSDVVSVHVGDGVHELSENVLCCGLGEGALFLNVVEEVGFEELEDEVDVGLVLLKIVELHDVGMGSESLHDLGLSAKIVAGNLAQSSFVDDLNGHREEVVFGVVTFDDFAVGARTKDVTEVHGEATQHDGRSVGIHDGYSIIRRS